MVITIAVFVVILGILVLVHELGHYLVARMIGVRVEEFGLGLPPRIFGKIIKNTEYSLNWLPIGGFVKLAGEDDEPDFKNRKPEISKNEKHYFWARSKTERSLILIAGVTMNFFLAVGITAWLLVGGVNEPSGKVRIDSVSPGSPADNAGLRAGDRIISVMSADKSSKVTPRIISLPQDMISATIELAGTPVKYEIERNKEIMTLIIIPRINPPKGEGAIGVSITDLELKKYPPLEAPFMALKINVMRTWLMLTGIAGTIWNLITLKTTSPDIAGPIGIAQVTGQAVKFGMRAVLEFMSILSLNLAVLNILPIPALDGGRLAFVFIEKILGRRVKPAFEKQTHQIGMIILLILVLLVSLNDILRLTRGG
jgi:regulator of sigma E protease